MKKHKSVDKSGSCKTTSEKKSIGPKVNCFRQNKSEARRHDMRITGPNTWSSLLWTLVVKKTNAPLENRVMTYFGQSGEDTC